MPQVEGLYFQTACVNQFMPRPGLSTPDMFVHRSHSSNVPFLCGSAGPRTVTSEAVSDPSSSDGVRAPSDTPEACLMGDGDMVSFWELLTTPHTGPRLTFGAVVSPAVVTAVD